MVSHVYYVCNFIQNIKMKTLKMDLYLSKCEYVCADVDGICVNEAATNNVTVFHI